MNEVKDLYYQISNREYLKNTFGREIWIQVSGHRELNKAHAGFWAALIPLKKVDDVFQSTEWDSHIGTQRPGFVGSGSNTFYQRLRLQTEFGSCENIVHFLLLHLKN